MSRTGALTGGRFFGLALLVMAVGAAAQGKKPEFRGAAPYSVLAGATTTVRILGQDLAPTEIRFEDSRISAKILKTGPLMPKNDDEKRRGNTEVEVEITAPGGLPAKYYRFNLLQEGGVSAGGKLLIDVPAPEIQEKEPNDTLRKPMDLPDGPVTVTGKLDNEGVDVFRFKAKAGETWHIEVFARRLNRATKLEPVIRIRDPRLAPIRAAVDQGDDCYIDLKVPVDGPYLIELFDGDNKSGADQAYRLELRRS
jgi:hypothetical protein